MPNQVEYVERWRKLIDKDISDLFIKFGAVLSYIQHTLTFDQEAKDPELVKASNMSRLEDDKEKSNKAMFFILFYRYDILMTLVDNNKDISESKEREIFSIMVDNQKLNKILSKIHEVRSNKTLDEFK